MHRITASKLKVEEGDPHIHWVALIQLHLVCLLITAIPLKFKFTA